MSRELAALGHVIFRIRRDIRILSGQMQNQIEADEDCYVTAQTIMRAQKDLRLYLERRENLLARVVATAAAPHRDVALPSVILF